MDFPNFDSWSPAPLLNHSSRGEDGGFCDGWEVIGP